MRAGKTRAYEKITYIDPSRLNGAVLADALTVAISRCEVNLLEKLFAASGKEGLEKAKRLVEMPSMMAPAEILQIVLQWEIK